MFVLTRCPTSDSAAPATATPTAVSGASEMTATATPTYASAASKSVATDDDENMTDVSDAEGGKPKHKKRFVETNCLLYIVSTLSQKSDINIPQTIDLTYAYVQD